MRPSRFFRRHFAGHSVFMTSEGRPLRILAIGDGDIASIELSLRIPLRWMSRTLGIKYNLIYAPDLPNAPSRDIDLVLLMRVYDKGSVSFTRSLKQMGIPYIYMMDDDLDLIDPKTPLGALLAAADARSNIATISKFASAVMVFSEALREKFHRYNPETFVMPAPSGSPHPLERATPARHAPEVRIGFAGGAVHADSLSIIENVIGDLLEANPALVFETIGQQSSGLAGHPRYRHFPFVPGGMGAFFQFLHSRAWDVGLAPLQDTVFNAAKTDNKYRTYASAGVPAIYSNVSSFRQSVRDMETGLLVDNTLEAWRNAIELLLRDETLRQSIVEAAASDVERRFNVPAVCLEYLRVIFAVLERSKVCEVSPALPTARGA